MIGNLKRTLLEALTKVRDKARSLSDQALRLSEQMKARNDAIEAKFESYWPDKAAEGED